MQLAARSKSSLVRPLRTSIGLRAAGSATRAIVPTPRPWDQAFIAIVDSLIQDAQDWEMPLPVTPLELRATLRRNQAALADVATPVLVHFDLWDGNILAEPAETGRWMLSGLVDGERHLFGDPLVDFISTALFRRIEDDPSDPFLTGYRRGSDAEIELSESAINPSAPLSHASLPADARRDAQPRNDRPHAPRALSNAVRAPHPRSRGSLKGREPRTGL